VGRADKPVAPAADSREEFLARWSRRKLDAGQDKPDFPGYESAAVRPAEPPQEPERELTDADMPPVETLDADSDYAPFLSPGVSDDLRQQALRKLFSQPDFNITDGLNDYDEDFTRFAGLGSMVTHEMKRLLQRELEKDSAKTTADADPATAADSHETVADTKENNANESVEPGVDPEDTA
jgi:hypothetical protein